MGQTNSRQYWERLDHLRGIAAFMVFVWHFTHWYSDVPAIAPSVLSILEEGHTGVALFMVLSGYLFAKIVGDRRIDFPRFVEARLRRLGPMLLVGLAAAYINAPEWWIDVPLGLVLPVWKNNGCWSVAVELQFYLLLPVLLTIFRRSRLAPLLITAVAVAVRVALYASGGDLQLFAYYSLLGRIDQFVLGIFAWRLVQGRAVPAPIFILGFGAFLIALHVFNLAGGFDGSAASPLWIWWPGVEALGYALLIAWYDGGSWSLPRPFAFVGKVSYSIYILHFIFVGRLADFALHTLHAKGFYGMLLLAVPAFAFMLPIAWAGWRFIETPALRNRRPYLLPAATTAELRPTASAA